MGATSTLISVNEYLQTVYEPECDYVDGVLEDRNVGEKTHAKVQKRLLLYMEQRHEAWDIFAAPELRVQVGPTRFRIPDVVVTVGPEPEEEILTQPPFLCIEILSPEDRMSRMQAKIKDYLDFGVGYVWVVDPRTRQAWVYTSEGMRDAVEELWTENPEIVVPLKEIFGN
jgi:Uma2 family endonuclease